MSNGEAYIIEIEGRPAGLVLADGRRGFRFFATAQPFYALNGRVFSRVDQAEQAARSLGRGLVSLQAHTTRPSARRGGAAPAPESTARSPRRTACHGPARRVAAAAE